MTDPLPAPAELQEQQEVGDFGGACRGGRRTAGATYPAPSITVSEMAEDIADVGSFGEHGSVVDHALPAADEGRDVGDTGASGAGSSKEQAE